MHIGRVSKLALRGVWLAGLALLTAVAYAQDPHPFHGHNSPVKMYSSPLVGASGGGIKTCGKKVWTHSFSLDSAYQATKIDMASTVNFTSTSGHDFSGDLSKGWIIVVDARNIDGSPKTGGIMLCSDSSCDGQEVDGNVYMRGITGSSMELHTAAESGEKYDHYHFHDKGNGCGYLPKTDGVCDIITSVTILSRTDPKKPLTSTGPLSCGNNDGNCMIEVGNPDGTDNCPIN